MIVAFDEFLRTIDTVKVEAERFPTLAEVRRESFGGNDHRAMLAGHELEVIRFESRGLAASRAGDVDGPARLHAATVEAMAYTPGGSEPIAATLARHRIQQEFNERETQK